MIKIRFFLKIVVYKVFFGYYLNLEKSYLSIDVNVNVYFVFN